MLRRSSAVIRKTCPVVPTNSRPRAASTCTTQGRSSRSPTASVAFGSCVTSPVRRSTLTVGGPTRRRPPKSVVHPVSTRSSVPMEIGNERSGAPAGSRTSSRSRDWMTMHAPSRAYRARPYSGPWSVPETDRVTTSYRSHVRADVVTIISRPSCRMLTTDTIPELRNSVSDSAHVVGSSVVKGRYSRARSNVCTKTRSSRPMKRVASSFVYTGSAFCVRHRTAPSASWTVIARFRSLITTTLTLVFVDTRRSWPPSAICLGASSSVRQSHTVVALVPPTSTPTMSTRPSSGLTYARDGESVAPIHASAETSPLARTSETIPWDDTRARVPRALGSLS